MVILQSLAGIVQYIHGFASRQGYYKLSQSFCLFPMFFELEARFLFLNFRNPKIENPKIDKTHGLTAEPHIMDLISTHSK